MRYRNMSYLKIFEDFEVYDKFKYTGHGIGDTFSDGYGSRGYRKDETPPRSIIQYRGYHPNIDMITGELRITDVDGDYWIFNNGQYKASKEQFENFESHRQQQLKRNEDEVLNRLESDVLSTDFPYKVGDKLVAKMDVNKVKPHVHASWKLTTSTWEGKPVLKKGKKKTIKSISSNGIMITGWRNWISFADVKKYFEI